MIPNTTFTAVYSVEEKVFPRRMLPGESFLQGNV